MKTVTQTPNDTELKLRQGNAVLWLNIANILILGNEMLCFVNIANILILGKEMLCFGLILLMYQY